MSVASRKAERTDRFILQRKSVLHPPTFDEMVEQIVRPATHFGPFFFPPKSPRPPVPSPQLRAHHSHDFVFDAPDLACQRNLLSTCAKPDATTFAVGLGASCFLWRPKDKPLELPSKHAVTSVALGPDAVDVAIGGFKRHALVIDTDAVVEYASLPRLDVGDRSGCCVQGMKWLDHKTLLVSIDNHFGIWDVREGAAHHLFKTDGLFGGFDVKDLKVVTTFAEDTRFELHDLRSCRAPYLKGDAEERRTSKREGKENKLGGDDAVTATAVFSKDASVFYTHSPSGLKRWSVRGTTLQTVVTGPWDPSYQWGALTISGDSSLIAASYGRRTEVFSLNAVGGGTIGRRVRAYENNEVDGTVLDMGFLNSKEGLDGIGTSGITNSLVSLCEGERITLNHMRQNRRKRKMGIKDGKSGSARLRWSSRLSIR